MIASRPEAEAKYSRRRVALRRRRGPLSGRSEQHRRRAQRGVQAIVLIGAAALVVAEFLPLYRVETGVGHHVVRSVSAGAHHSYALLPVAVLAALLAGALGRVGATGSGWALPAALVALGLAALGIALLGDLPDVHRTGVLGTPASGLYNVHTVAGPALYLETLGAVALLIGGGAGFVFGPAFSAPSASRRTPRTVEKSGS